MDESLQQLHDLHVPQLPGLWPPAPGWWLLAALVIGLLVMLGLHWYRWRRSRRPFRVALAALDRLLQQAREADLPPGAFANDVNALLKRALIHGANRNDVAPLTGEAWLVYLNGLTGSDTFSRSVGAALGNRRFAPDFRDDPEPLYSAAREVLRSLRKVQQP